MPKLFAATIALFLLLSAGYAITQAARTIPWDCSDWQAFAHADRTTAILESLAENRGKTLYCGLDQSDTFAKAETWQAGKDRNERDDTVYDGERGRFRGFIAAQEGWLTDGESGITGQSTATIFEFPKEPRRIKRYKRVKVGSGPPIPDEADVATCGQIDGPLCSDWGTVAAQNNSLLLARNLARAAYDGRASGAQWQRHWQRDKDHYQTGPGAAGWQQLATDVARRACRAQGSGYAVVGVHFHEGHNEIPGVGNQHRGDHLGWFFQDTDGDLTTAPYTLQARESRTWSATCKKTIRRARR